MEADVEALQARWQALRQQQTTEVESLHAAVSSACCAATDWLHEVQINDRAQQVAEVERQDMLTDQVYKAKQARIDAAKAQAASVQERLATLTRSVVALADTVPDLSQMGGQLTSLRSELDGARLARREAGEAAARCVEGRLKGLHRDIDQECSALESMQQRLSGILAASHAELRGMLEDERLERVERHAALMEVVKRTKNSLEASTFDALGGVVLSTKCAVPVPCLLADASKCCAPGPSVSPTVLSHASSRASESDSCSAGPDATADGMCGHATSSDTEDVGSEQEDAESSSTVSPGQSFVIAGGAR